MSSALYASLLLFLGVVSASPLRLYDCKTATVGSPFSTCFDIYINTGISPSQFNQYNPGLDCETLQLGQKVCVSLGSLPSSAPRPNPGAQCTCPRNSNSMKFKSKSQRPLQTRSKDPNTECGFYITKGPGPDSSSDDFYKFELVENGPFGGEHGHIIEVEEVPGMPVIVTDCLPDDIKIYGGNVDTNGARWSVGDSEDGDGEMDCGFTC